MEKISAVSIYQQSQLENVIKNKYHSQEEQKKKINKRQANLYGENYNILLRTFNTSLSGKIYHNHG